jgi:hypothetical protein
MGMPHGDPFVANAIAFTRLGDWSKGLAQNKDAAADADALLLIRRALDGAVSASTVLQCRRIDMEQWSRNAFALAMQYDVVPQNER